MLIKMERQDDVNMKAIVLNVENCSGCGQCELICSVKKLGSADPARSNIHVIKYERDGAFLVASCMQCRTPVCREVCPVRAIEENPTTGALVVDEEKCIGCEECVDVCPSDVYEMQDDKSVPVNAEECIGCEACVEACE